MASVLFSEKVWLQAIGGDQQRKMLKCILYFLCARAGVCTPAMYHTLHKHTHTHTRSLFSTEKQFIFPDICQAASLLSQLTTPPPRFLSCGSASRPCLFPPGTQSLSESNFRVCVCLLSGQIFGFRKILQTAMSEQNPRHPLKAMTQGMTE